MKMKKKEFAFCDKIKVVRHFRKMPQQKRQQFHSTNALERDHCLRMSWASVTFFVLCEIPSDRGMKQWCEIVFVLLNVACRRRCCFTIQTQTDIYESNSSKQKTYSIKIRGAANESRVKLIKIFNGQKRNRVIDLVKCGNWLIHKHTLSRWPYGKCFWFR